jgi:hypothetical protein
MKYIKPTARVAVPLTEVHPPTNGLFTRRVAVGKRSYMDGVNHASNRTMGMEMRIPH